MVFLNGNTHCRGYVPRVAALFIAAGLLLSSFAVPASAAGGGKNKKKVSALSDSLRKVRKVPSAGDREKFRDFALKTGNPGWRIRYNPKTGLPESITRGRTKKYSGTPERAAESFFGENGDLLKIDTSTLRIVLKKEFMGVTHIQYQQYYKGLPVEFSYARAHITADGEISGFQSKYEPGVNINTQPTLTAAQAVQAASSDLGAQLRKTKTGLVIFPDENSGELKLVWKVEGRSAGGNWVYYIDAASGGVLFEYDDTRRYCNNTYNTMGSSSGTVYEISPIPTGLSDYRAQNLWAMPVLKALSDQYFWVGSYANTPAVTDTKGDYCSNTPGKVFATFKGPYFSIANSRGASAHYDNGGGVWRDYSHPETLETPHPYANSSVYNIYGNVVPALNAGETLAKIMPRFDTFRAGSMDEYGNVGDPDWVNVINPALLGPGVEIGSVGSYIGTRTKPFFGAAVENDSFLLKLISDAAGTDSGFSVTVSSYLVLTNNPAVSAAPSAVVWSTSNASVYLDKSLGSVSGLDEANAFYHLNKARRFFETMNNQPGGGLPKPADLDARVPVMVHASGLPDAVPYRGMINGFYDRETGGLIFGDGPDDYGYRSLALDGTIVRHEYTHLVIDRIYPIINFGEFGAISEALADYFSLASFWREGYAESNNEKKNISELANFLGDLYARPISGTDSVMPGSWQGEIYNDSLILSQALYSLRQGGARDLGTISGSAGGTFDGLPVADFLAWAALFYFPDNFTNFSDAMLDACTQLDSSIAPGSCPAVAVSSLTAAFAAHGIIETAGDAYEAGSALCANNNGPECAYSVAASTALAATIYPTGDVDYYSLTLASGTFTATLDLPYEVSSAAYNAYALYLFDSERNYVAEAVPVLDEWTGYCPASDCHTLSSTAALTYQVPAGGRYYLAIAGGPTLNYGNSGVSSTAPYTLNFSYDPRGAAQAVISAGSFPDAFLIYFSARYNQFPMQASPSSGTLTGAEQVFAYAQLRDSAGRLNNTRTDAAGSLLQLEGGLELGIDAEGYSVITGTARVKAGFAAAYPDTGKVSIEIMGRNHLGSVMGLGVSGDLEVLLPFTAVSTGSLTANWVTTLSTDTVYHVRLSSLTNSGLWLSSAQTTAASQPFAGLQANTSYYAFVSTSAGSGFIRIGYGATHIEAPTSVYFDEIGTTTIVASGYAVGSAFGNLGVGLSGVSVSIDGNYPSWHGGNSWANKASIPSAYTATTRRVVNVAGKVYLFTAFDNSHTGPETIEYDPVLNTWAHKATMPSLRNDYDVAASGGKIYAIGGIKYEPWGHTNEIYDPVSNSWDFRAEIPSSRYGLRVYSSGGKLYAVGGFNGNTQTTANEVYDPEEDVWFSRADLPAPFSSFATAIVQNKLYAFRDANHFEYDINADTWAIKTPMPTYRHYPSAATIGGKIYALGGTNYDNEAVAANEVYDPNTDTWASRISLPIPKHLEVVAAGGKLYAMSGNPGSLQNLEYDPGVSGAFQGLLPNTSYAFRAKARNLTGVETGESVSVSTYTLAVVGSGYFSGVDGTTITVNWSSGSVSGGFNGPGASYKIQAATSSAFIGSRISSATSGLGATFTGLTPGVTYYFRVQAYNAVGVTDYSWRVLGSTRIPAPPVITSLNAVPAAIPSAGTASLSCAATSPVGAVLNYAWSSGSGSFTGSGANVEWMAPVSTGSYILTCEVSDGQGGLTSQNINVLVNNPPNIESLSASPTIVRPTEVSTITCAAFDPDNPWLFYTWTATGGGIVNLSSGVAAWTAPAATGTFTIGCEVSDAEGGIDQAVLQLQVATVPAIINLSATPDMVARQEESTLVCIATGPGSGPLVYSWQAASGTLTAYLSSATWTAPDATGTFVVGCEVSADGGVTSAQTNIYVNSPPIVSAMSAIPAIVSTGASAILTCAAADPDGDELVYNWSVNAGTVSGSGAEVVWTAPLYTGAQQATCQVSDGHPGGAVQQSQYIYVATKPVITYFAASPDIVARQATSLVVCAATAPDSGAISYSWQASSGSFSSVFLSSAIWTAPNAAGTYLLGCEASVSGRDSAATFVGILVNSPPEIVDLMAAPMIVQPGGPAELTCAAVDADGDGLEYTWHSDAGSISGAGPTVTWAAPASTGNYSVSCEISDGKIGGTAQSVTQLVVATGPVILSLAAEPTIVPANGVSNIVCIATAPDGNNIAYNWSAASGTLSLVGSGVAWTAPASTGSFLVNCLVTNDFGGSAQQSINIQVQESTAASAGELSAAAVSDIGVGSLLINWGSTYVLGTTYYVRLSTVADAALFVSSGSTTAQSYPFTDLSPNTLYYGFVSTSAASGFLQSGAGYTLSLEPAFVYSETPRISPLAAVSTGSLVVSWSNQNPAGTLYLVEVSSLTDPFTAYATYTVYGDSANLYGFNISSLTIQGLELNSLYSVRVTAFNGDGLPTPAIPMAIYTMPELPSAPLITSAVFSGATLAWSAGANPPATIYELRGSTMPDFSGTPTVYIPFAASYSASTAAVSGLWTGTTYYFDVGAGPGGHSYDGYQRSVSAPYYNAAGPAGAPSGSIGGTSDPAAGVVIAGVTPGGRAVSVAVPTEAYLDATRLAVADSAVNACSYLVGDHPVSVSIYSEGGAQPQAPVLLSLSYNAYEAVSGISQNLGALALAYYDPIEGRCVSLPTTIDPGNRTITSTVTAVGFYQLAPAQVAPGGVAGVSVGSMTANWSSTFVAGTTYYLRLCGEEDPELYQFLDFTTDLSYAFTGLAANTSYYAYVSTEEAGGFMLAGAAATLIETPASVYFDEIGTNTVIASAYAASLTNLDQGLSGAALAAGAAYGAWTSGGNTWTSKTAMPTARHGAAAAAIGGKIYVVGGFSTAQTDLNEEYDPVSNAWTIRAAMPTARRYHGAAAANGILYAIGGENSTVYSKNEAYDPVSNTWTTKASMSVSRYHPAVAAVNGRIYAIGGNNIGLITANQEYNPQTNTWVNKAPLPQGRDQFAIGVVDGKIYAAGGMELATSSRTEEYNPVTNTWTQKAYMPSVRSALAGAVIGGKFYAVGGINGVNLGLNYEYDPQADAWTARATMPTARRALTAAAAGGRLYAFGGITTGATAANEEYYPGAAATVGGLQPNTLYTFKAKARNLAGVETAESPEISTYTLAAVGGGAFTGVSSGALTVTWSSGSAVGGYNGPGASYKIQYSTNANFAAPLVSSTTANLALTLAGLAPATTYYFRAQAYNAAGVTDHSWTALGSTATPAAVVFAEGQVYVSTITVGDGGYGVCDAGSNGGLGDADRAFVTTMSGNAQQDSSLIQYEQPWSTYPGACLALCVDVTCMPTGVPAYFGVDEISFEIFKFAAGSNPLDPESTPPVRTFSIYSPAVCDSANSTPPHTQNAPVPVGRFCVPWDGQYNLNGYFGKTNGQFGYRAKISYAQPDGGGGQNIVEQTSAFPGQNQYPIQVDVTNVHLARSSPAVVGAVSPVEAQPYGIQYRLSKDATATLTVWNSDFSALVRTLVSSQPRVGEGTPDGTLLNQDFWDGRGADGGLVPAGSYRVRIAAGSNDAWPGDDLAWPATVQVTVDPLRLTDVIVSPDAPSLAYKLTEAATVYLDVYTPGASFTGQAVPPVLASGSLVRRIAEFRGARLSTSTAWDGLDAGGQPAVPGQYVYALYAILPASGSIGGQSWTEIKTQQLVSGEMPFGGVLSAGAFSGVGASSLTVNWGSTYAGGTVYHVRLSTTGGAGVYVASGSTTGLSYGFTGLAANTSYYGYVSTDAAVGFVLAGEAATLIETPSGVYIEGIGTTTVVASAYATSLTGLDSGLSGVSLSTGAGYEVWTGSGNYWAAKQGLPSLRTNLTVAVVGNKLYAIGGMLSGTDLNLNQEYDPVSNSWTNKAAMPTARQELASGVIGGKIYVLGGASGSSILAVNEEYDPAANAWSGRRAMPTARYFLGVAVVGARLYALEGIGGSGYLNVNEEYDPVTDTWAAKNAMPTRRSAFGVGVINEKIYCAGGIDSGMFLDTNEQYDPATDTWTSKRAMPTGRNLLGGAAHGGKLYAVGGSTGGATLAVNEVYDPASDTWTAMAPMPAAKRNFGIGVLEGKIYAVGGYDNTYLGSNLQYMPGNSSTFSGLLPNTLYTFKAKARNLAGVETAESPEVSTYTLAVVGGGAFTGVSSGALTVSWSSGSAVGGFNGPGASYKIQYSTNANFAAPLVSSATAGMSLTLAGLAPATTYYIRAQAYNAAGVTDYSWTALGSTVTAVEVDVTPPAGAILFPPNYSTQTAVAQIYGTAFDSSGLQLEYLKLFITRLSDSNNWDGSDFSFPSGGTGQSLVYSTPAWSYDASSVAWVSGDSYGLTLFMLDKAGQQLTLYSTFTYQALPASGTVSGLAGAALSSTSVLWTWSAGSVGAADGYKIYAATGGLLGTAAFGSTAAFTQEGLGPNAPASVKVAAYTAGGDGPLAQGATVYTLAAEPAGLGITARSSHSVTLAWADGGNPAGTVYRLARDTNAGFTAPVLSSGTALTAGATGLAAGTTYYFKVQALNAGGLATAYTAAVSTRTAPPAPPAPAAPAGTALGVSSISWNWSAVAGAASYKLYYSTGGLAAAPAGAPYAQEGLPPNAAYSLKLAAVNETGESAPSAASAAVYTLANPPSGASTAAVYATSATIVWSLNGNPTGSITKLQRTGGTRYFSGGTLGTSYTDGGLDGCTTYQYRLWYVNGANLPTASVYISSVVTGAPVPSPPGALFAAPLAGNRILLSWEPAWFEGITAYKVYYDSGTGTIDYNTPLATVPGTQYSYTTGVLTSSAAYRFGLRATHRCGLSEANETVRASAASVYSLTGVRAAIKIPQTGKRVNGNSVTVKAELLTGTAADVKNVRFQYKASAASVWNNIVAANVNHPNPDATYEYFVHWDVTGLAAGGYDLRAVATDLGNAQDASPAAITITVDAADPDIFENTQAGGEVKKEQKVSNLVANTLQAGDAASPQVTQLIIPAEALDDSTATVAVVNSPPLAPPAPADATPAGVVAEITLSNQTVLANGKTAEVTLSYPDADNNGVVDGTNILAAQLVMYSASSAAGPWNQDLGSVVDTAGKKVKGNTSHFSYFALFAPLAANLNSARAYPVPWRPGSSGDYRSPPGADGIVFDNLTDYAEIKIFTVTGQLVRELSVKPADLGYKVWDGRNSAGFKAASGLYLAHIKANGKVKVLKVAIER